MQRFINNWAATLAAPAASAAPELTISADKAAELVGLGAGDYYLLTLAKVVDGAEVDWEIVKVTGAASGVLDVERGQEGTAELEWLTGEPISARFTAGSADELRTSGGAAVGDATPLALGTPSAGTSELASRQDHRHALPSPADIGAATATQGGKADTAVQPAALAAGLDGKVDKVAGKQLSQEDFTSTLRTKLVGLESPNFRGTFTTFAAMVAGVASPVAGNYADVDAGAGSDVVRYIWDATDSEWQTGTGGGGPASTDALPEGLTNLYHTAARVLAVVLSGLSLATGGAVVSTDNVLAAIGKLQRQINDHFGAGGAAHAAATTSVDGFMVAADKEKLNGVATGATANDTDSNLKNRANHTGGQPISTVTGLEAALSAKQAGLVSGTNIKTINGASLLGGGNIDIGGGSASSVYATAAIASGALELDLATAQTFGVMLNANVTTLTLSGAVSGERSSIEVIFSQSMAGGFSVSKPANVRLFDGAPNIASTSARDITYARFTSVDGGVSWLLDERKIFLVPPTVTLPTVTTENFINNDEGDSTSGWSATNGTLSTSSSWLRFTKTAGGSSASSTKTLGTPISTAKDWIEYVSVRASADSNNISLLGLTGSSGSIFSLWLNSANASTYTAGAVSFQYWNGSSVVASPQVAGATVSSSTPLNLAIQYDNKFGSLTVWVRQSDGRYKFGCRFSCSFFAIQTASLQFATAAPAASWVEFDYRSMCNPNFAAIGDSITEGKNGFSPTVALGLSNDETTWMRHAPLYPALRNNLIVNKGVGSNTSAAILARITDVTTLGAQVVFLQCSTNDAVGPVAQAARASNIQSSVNATVAASAEVVLLNSVYGAESNSLNPGARDYYKESWDDYMPSITGVAAKIDTMLPIVSAAGFMADAFTDADKIHLNQSGAAAVGAYIAS
ncbi:SGNH/GDSL hydrolase family protein [Pseudomonas sp.]|uniref:SGNH/GDSL hydrolase family protein n=1 Tax=Pseudomonas sp. TaxID=306 RepID=UPI002735C4F0|nr:SGNH/GDSL hydrolase family protein [Pseudomonas sp.]MDP2746207.1 SGNH/GDSL hydrolase family protein [Pseudomonas sp.]